MEIAVRENSSLISQADLAFLVRAVNIQAEQHMAPAFEEEPWPIRSYSSLQALPPDTFHPLAILDDIQKDGALGFHDDIAGLIFGRVLASNDPTDGVTLSHECCELRGDPECSIWLLMPDGRKVAYERSDPCEQDRYQIDVMIGAETRRIWVSDFVLPAWFVPGAPGPYTYLDTVDAPFGLSRSGGGYRLVMDQQGNVSSDFDGRNAAAHDKLARKVTERMSRTYRRGLR